MRLTAHGIDTHYQKIGQGPVLVLLHGWGCDWQIWSPVVTALSEDFQLIIPDLPAFGTSSNPEKVWDSFDYRQWLADFLSQTTNSQSFAVVGHSFGGKIAALYASHLPPTQLKALVLVDSAGLPDKLSLTRQTQHKVLGMIPSALKNKVPAHFKEKLLAATQSSSDHYHSTPSQREILKRIVGENIAPQLPHIKVPTLLIWGQNDHDTPLHHAHQFAESIPDSTLGVFANSGHFPFVDETGPFLTTLKKHLHYV